MAQFKGDSNYKPFYDDLWDNNSADSADDEPLQRDPSRKRRAWLDEHYEVLMELYRAFKANGESVFGNCFFRNGLGDFHKFVHFVYENTLPPDADLLKAKTTQTHVRALGLSARSQHRLPVIQTAADDGSYGGGDPGVRGCWSEAVRAGSAERG